MRRRIFLLNLNLNLRLNLNFKLEIWIWNLNLKLEIEFEFEIWIWKFALPQSILIDATLVTDWLPNRPWSTSQSTQINLQIDRMILINLLINPDQTTNQSKPFPQRSWLTLNRPWLTSKSSQIFSRIDPDQPPTRHLFQMKFEFHLNLLLYLNLNLKYKFEFEFEFEI